MNVKAIICGLLATTAFGAGAATVAASGETRVQPAEATVTNGSYRVNVLTATNAFWSNDNIWTAIQLHDDECSFTSADSDLGSAVTNKSNWRQITISGTNYYFQTIELSSSYSTTWWAPQFQRCNSSTGGGWWNKITAPSNEGWANKTINTVLINNTPSASNFGSYYKFALHTGLNLENTSYELVSSTGTPSAPSSINGYEFAGWYTDEDLTTAWTSGSQYTDINLYAKYRKPGYYLVGDSNFIDEFDAGSKTWLDGLDDAVLMDTPISGDNKASYTFTTTQTITFKAYHWSSSDPYWVSNTEKSDSATAAGVTFDKDGNYVVPAGTYSLYVFVKNNQDTSSLTYGMPLDSYCTDFLTQTGAKCAGDDTVKSQLAAVWSNMETNWGKLSDDDQTTLRNAVASESGTDVQKVMARYDHIVHKYSDFNDFMTRKSNANYTYKSAVLNSISNSDNGLMLAIVLISTVSICVLGAFLILKKKKEQK